MGFLDELKEKAGELGEKAKEGLETAKEKAGDIVDDVKDKLHHSEAEAPAERQDREVPAAK